MPDSKKITLYPNYAFEDGSIPGLRFRADLRRVYVDCCNPAYALGNLGSRVSLG